MSLVADKPKRKTRRHYYGFGAVERGDSWRIWWYAEDVRQFATIPKSDFPIKGNAINEAIKRKSEGHINEATVTFEEWSKKYIDSRKDINQEPLTRFSRHFITFLKDKGYDTRLRKITEEVVREFLFDYKSKNHNDVGTNKALENIRQIFRAARKILPQNPTEGIKRFKAEKRIVIIPSMEERNKVLKWFLKNERSLFPWAYFEMTRGWRRSELGKIRVSSIDLDRKRIRVIHYKQKNEKEHPLNDEEVNILNEHFILLKKLKLYKADGFLFPTKSGRMKNKETMRLKYKQAAKDLGITKNLHNHIWRHFVITTLRDSGMTSENIAKITGHDDTETIDRVYTHASTEIVERGMEILKPDLGREFKRG